MEGTTVDSDAFKLVIHFKATDSNFKSLLDSPMFASVVR